MDSQAESSIEEVRAFPLFQRLVAIARKRQHGQLTERQAAMLLSAFLATQRREAGLLIGWCFGHKQRVNRALKIEGITVRHPSAPKLHRFKLSQTGMARLSELEASFSRRDERRKRQSQD